MFFWSLFFTSLVFIIVCMLVGWAVTAILEKKSSQ